MTTQTGLWAGMVAVVAALSAIGCGSSKDPVGGPQYAYPDVASYCAARAKAECSAAVLDGCQSAESACMTTRQGICGQSVPSGSDYRPTQAETCLAAVTAAYTDDKFTATEKAAIEKACATLFGGLGGEGSPCTDDDKCNLDAGLRCLKPTGADAGTCQIPDEKKPGESCSAANATCQEGNFCTSSTPKVCANKLPENEGCNDVLPCADTLRCVPTDPPATDGTCQQRLTIQSPCTADDECADGLCIPIGGENKCASSIKFAPNEPICEDFR